VTRLDRPGRAVPIALLLALAMMGAACSSGGRAGDAPTTTDGTATTGPDRAPSDDATARTGPGPVALDTLAELDAPIDAAALADGTILVALRAGRIVALDPSGEVSAPLLDLSDRTTTDGERGLLSIAVPAAEDLVVLSFTDLDGATTLEAYPLTDGRPDVGGRRALWRLEQPYANHNGGAVRFGPDGMLHLALGDGGSRNDPLDAGQDLSTPLGSIVRFDVGGSGAARIPDDNPYVGRIDAHPAILAHGLRNPWRFSFDVEGGHVWIGDVGQRRREEIDRVPLDEFAGANLGWARLEGSLPFRGEPPAEHVLPVHEYDHGPGCSVTGGVVYRGRALPGLVGAYLFSDHCDGTIRALVDDGAGGLAAIDLGVAGDQVVGFAPDADGEVLVLDLAGRISRIVPA
jgi:glucose/arabinose dehydrogenase